MLGNCWEMWQKWWTNVKTCWEWEKWMLEKLGKDRNILEKCWDNWWFWKIWGCWKKVEILFWLGVFGETFRTIWGVGKCEVKTYLGVSWHRATPKSSILIGFSLINHPAIGDTPLMEKPVWKDLRWSLACMVEVWKQQRVNHINTILETVDVCIWKTIHMFLKQKKMNKRWKLWLKISPGYCFGRALTKHLKVGKGMVPGNFHGAACLEHLVFWKRKNRYQWFRRKETTGLGLKLRVFSTQMEVSWNRATPKSSILVGFPIPICSMYGIFANICPKNHPNAGKYAIPGASEIINHPFGVPPLVVKHPLGVSMDLPWKRSGWICGTSTPPCPSSLAVRRFLVVISQG